MSNMYGEGVCCDELWAGEDRSSYTFSRGLAFLSGAAPMHLVRQCSA